MGDVQLTCGPDRGVAQPGSALVWGASGRRFKSYRPDQFSLAYTNVLRALFCAVTAGSQFNTESSPKVASANAACSPFISN